MTEDAPFIPEAETAERDEQELQPTVTVPKKWTRKPKAAAKTWDAASEQEVQEQSETDHPHKVVPEQFLKDLALFADLLDKTPALLDPIDSKTFPRMVNAMSMLLGPAATMVVMMACHVNSAAFFENLLYAVQDEKSRGAVWIIQHLTALYGNLVQQAYTLLSGKMYEDWHTVDVNTYRLECENPYWIVLHEDDAPLRNGSISWWKFLPQNLDEIFRLKMWIRAS